MERLLWLLEEVNNSACTPRDYLNENHHSAVPLIKSLLCELLITAGGNLNWDVKDVIESYGFEVFPVEKDQAGWIIGAVQTEKGAITFG